jgi:hypothetical protein
VSARPTCECGSCQKCKARACVARSRARKRGRGAHPRPWLPEPAAKPRTLGVPVDANAVAYLGALRALAGPGAVVGVGAYGVMIDTTAGRRTWPDLDSCLAELTLPAEKASQ